MTLRMRYLLRHVVDACMGKLLEALNLIKVSPKCLRTRFIMFIQYACFLRPMNDNTVKEISLLK
jgi:hypothetical protein